MKNRSQRLGELPDGGAGSLGALDLAADEGHGFENLLETESRLLVSLPGRGGGSILLGEAVGVGGFHVHCSLFVGGGEKGYQNGSAMGTSSMLRFSLLIGGLAAERPEAVKGAPLLGAAKRTLDGEDRSEMIAEEGKAGANAGRKWAAKVVHSPTASNTLFLLLLLSCGGHFVVAPMGTPPVSSL
jgi:hypothetical protein